MSHPLCSPRRRTGLAFSLLSRSPWKPLKLMKHNHSSFAHPQLFTSLLPFTEESHLNCEGLAFVPLIFIGPLTRSDALE